MPSSSPARLCAVARRAVALSAILAFAASALAYDGLSVGVSTGVPVGDGVVNVRAVQPLATFAGPNAPLTFAVRADVASAVAFDRLPAVGLGAVAAADADGIGRYLGLGAGLQPGAASTGSLWSVYGLAGWRVPVAGGLHGALEVLVAGNDAFLAPRVNLALEYTFGGAR